MDEARAIGSVLLSLSLYLVLQEAVSTRDPELVRLVLRYRDYQRTAKRLAGIPVLLERLRQVGFHRNTCTHGIKIITHAQFHRANEEGLGADLSFLLMPFVSLFTV